MTIDLTFIVDSNRMLIM